MTPEETNFVLSLIAERLIQKAAAHPWAPEGLELFDWTWVPEDAHPEVIFLREAWVRRAFLAQEGDPLLDTPAKTDRVTPSPLTFNLAVCTAEGDRTMTARVGWNQEARRAVLWFADGPRRS